MALAYPSIYNVAYSYTGFQQAQQGISAFPGTQLDADLAGLRSSVSSLALFTQGALRSDGALNNGLVTFDSLAPSLQTNGIASASAWATGIPYSVGSPIVINGNLYRCAVLHTAGVFATDLAAGKWTFVTVISGAFIQSGAGAVSITIDAIFRAILVMPEMFGTNGIDDGPAINAAITYAATVNAKVTLKPTQYNIVTPIVDSFGVQVIGASYGTVFNFAPTGNNQICYRVRHAGSIVTAGALENVLFTTADTTNTKTAVELEDVSTYRFRNIIIKGATVGGNGTLTWGGAGSIGFRTRGREFIRTDGLQIAADRPIVVSKNPNGGPDWDYPNYNNLQLLANGNPNFEIETGVNFTHAIINGIACVLGTHGIYHSDTTSTGVGAEGLTITNLGSEQGTSNASNTIYIHRNTPLYGLKVGGFQIWDGQRKGFDLHNVADAKFDNVVYLGNTLECIRADATVGHLKWENCYWGSGATVSLTGQNIVHTSQTPAGRVVSSTAEYTNGTGGPVFPLNMTILSGGGGSIAVLAPVSAAFWNITWPSTTTTLIGKDTTDTLTNKSIVGGTHDSLTSFGIRSTGAAFDLKYASAEVLTANHTINWVVGNADRTVTLGGNPTLNGGTHSGTNTGDQAAGFGLTLTTGTFAVDLTANFTWSGSHTFSSMTLNAAAGGQFVLMHAGTPKWDFGIANAITGSLGDTLGFYSYTLAGYAVTVDVTTGATLFANSALSKHPTAGVGYAAGAGGTVAQATSKATGVTLNTVSGQITLNAAALAAGAIVSFVLTDSAIAATDVLILNHISGGTPGSYTLNARAAAGSATIDVANRSAGSLSEAIVIQFAVVKAVNA